VTAPIANGLVVDGTELGAEEAVTKDSLLLKVVCPAKLA